MASVEEYLRREVGVPPLPPNQNNSKLEDPSTTNRGGQSGIHKDNTVVTSRGGNPGEYNPESATTKRGGNPGKYNPDSATTSRSGIDGSFDPEASTTKRPKPTKSEYGIPLVPTRGGRLGHYTDPTSERPVDHKEEIQIDTSRGGDPGKYDPKSTTTQRGGVDGSFDPEASTTKRSESTRSDYEVPLVPTRGGRSGSINSEISTTIRAGEEGSPLEDLNTQRPESTPYKPSDVSAHRPASTVIPGEEPIAQRPPHHVTHQDIETDAHRQPKIENPSKDLEATRPVSLNEIINQLQFLAGSGSNILSGPIGSQVNSLMDKWANKTYKQVTNTAMNTEDLYSYFKRLIKSNTNLLTRIPLDVGLRLLTQLRNQRGTKLRNLLIEGQDQLAKNPIKGSRKSLEDPFGNSKIKLADQGLGKTMQGGVTGFSSTGAKITLGSDAGDRESWKAENRVKNSKGNYQDPHHKEGEPTDYRNQFYGYRYDPVEEAVVKTVLQVANRIRQATESNTLSTTNLGKGNPQDFWGGNYSRWSGFEMADNFYWGVSVKREEKVGEYKTELPKFPKEFPFRDGWWPVTACNFSKGALQSKSFTLPFFNLVIPNSGERPSALKLTVLDNVKHDIRYYLEKYITKCFDVEKNLVLPYKNIIWCIEVYRFDRNISVLYKKGLLCILSNWQATFDGATGHSEDELDLIFEIVGEYEIPENNSNSTSEGGND